MSSEFCLLLNIAFVMLVITSSSSPLLEPTYIIIVLHDVEN